MSRTNSFVLQMDTFVKNPVIPSESSSNVVVTKTQKEMIPLIFNELSNFINASKSSIVTVGLSGGSMIAIMSGVIKKLDKASKNKLKLFPVDERLVPLDDEESNTGTYLKAFGNDFKEKFVIVEEIDDTSIAAKEFEKKLKKLDVEKTADGLPMFDFLYLGMGPDGHTCSLFPDHKLLKYSGSSWILQIEDSPKPPSRRITISLDLCNAAKNTIFIVTGENKADILKEIIHDKSESYPAGLVKASKWYLDELAGKHLGIEITEVQ